jgi:Cu-Zn family superoxide dismutase
MTTPIAAAFAAVLALAASGGALAQQATATLKPTAGNTAAGTVTFTMQGGQVAVQARVTGLKPNAEHGFHLHEKGDCSGPDGNSAGGHFNPDGKPHGPQDAPHHAGDMPALKADGSGVAEARFTLTGVSVGSGAGDVVGKGLIVHAQPDDYKTQPTGNAGARLACGVVTAQ